MTFTYTQPTQVWLDISPKEIAQAWENSQSLSTSESRWNAYLNQLSLQAVLAWITEEVEPTACAWMREQARLSVWEVVNGASIILGEKRIVLVPTEALDDEELRVPQEWVDIPSWVGDYYLAVQVNPDEQGIRIWGYTTHQQLKAKGHYNAQDRSYSLEGNDLIQDVNVLCVAYELCRAEQTRVAVAPLSIVPTVQAENLAQRLGNQEVVFPRLAIPFTLWGALLEQDSWRNELYQRRTGNLNQVRPLVNLGEWLQNCFDSSWQSLESLFPETQPIPIRFRSTETETTILQRGKLINLGTPEETVILQVDVTPETDERLGIRIQVRPREGTRYVPAQLQLLLCSDVGETIQRVSAREEDNWIQIKRFKCSAGTRFQIHVVLGEASYREDFQV